MPLRPRIGSIRSTRSLAPRVRAETFTDRRRPPQPGCRCQRPRAAQAIPITCRSISWIRPQSSAASMNDAGSSRPRCGCCQRARASNPTSLRSCSCTIGCRKQPNWPSPPASRSDSSRASRSLACWRMAGSNRAKRPRPRLLARYIAMSAFSITADGASPASAMQMPMEAEGLSSTPATRTGSRIAPITRLASSAAASPPATRVTRMNSSPESRPTRSSWRTERSRIRLMCTSSSSPAPWPWASLTHLKRSMSMNSTAVLCSRSGG